MCLWYIELVAALEWWSGTECTLYTDPKSYELYGKENAVVVLNHSFEIDFLCGWTFCERFGVLGVKERNIWNIALSNLELCNFEFETFQSSKVLAKKELAYVPVIGWSWYFLEIVFCKRRWEEDRRTVAESLQNLHDYPENFWVSRSLCVFSQNNCCFKHISGFTSYFTKEHFTPGPSSCFSVKELASQKRSTRSACRWLRVKVYPSWSIICCPGLKDSG